MSGPANKQPPGTRVCRQCKKPQPSAEFIHGRTICFLCRRDEHKGRNVVRMAKKATDKKKAVGEAGKDRLCLETAGELRVMRPETFFTFCAKRQEIKPSQLAERYTPDCQFCKAKELVKKGQLPDNIKVIES